MSRAYYAALQRLSNCAGWRVWWGILWVLPLLLLSWGLSAVPALSADSWLARGRFSTARPGDVLPEGWEPLIFKKIARHTVYRLVVEQATVVLQARSLAAASGLRREIELDPQLYPLLHWRWKVTAAPRTSDVRHKESDDAPARLSVAFAYDETQVSWLERAEFELARSLYGQYPPLATVMYVWERDIPVDTLVTSPYTKRVKMFVLRNSTATHGRWYGEQRNVYEDYRRAFGGTPPRIVGVALMTDTDNTGETATAYYGDVLFLRAAP